MWRSVSVMGASRGSEEWASHRGGMVPFLLGVAEMTDLAAMLLRPICGNMSIWGCWGLFPPSIERGLAHARVFGGRLAPGFSTAGVPL